MPSPTELRILGLAHLIGVKDSRLAQIIGVKDSGRSAAHSCFEYGSGMPEGAMPSPAELRILGLAQHNGVQDSGLAQHRHRGFWISADHCINCRGEKKRSNRYG